MDRMIGFDPQLLHDALLTAINVLILFFGLSYFLWNPIRDLLAKRKQKIADDLKAADRDREEAGKLKAEYEARLKKIDEEADELLEAARKKARAGADEILGAARTEAALIVERGTKEVQLEKKKAADELKSDLVAIASLMAEKAVAGAVDVKVHERLIDEAIDEIGAGTWQS